MASIYAALRKGSDIVERDCVNRVVKGSESFGIASDGVGAVPLRYCGVFSPSDCVALVGAIFFLVEGITPTGFKIVAITEGSVEAHELQRPRTRPPSRWDAQPTTSSLSSSTSAVAQTPATGNNLRTPSPHFAGEILKFPAAILESLWLANAETITNLENDFIFPIDFVSAMLMLSLSGETVVKLWRHGGSRGKDVAATFSVVRGRGRGTVGAGVEAGGVSQKADECNIPLGARSIFTRAMDPELFEGKDRVVGNIVTLYATCMVQGGSMLAVGDGRFDVNNALLVHLPHREMQDILRFRFPGLCFFQPCLSESVFAGYAKGLTKADQVPRILCCAVALESLENLHVLLQRFFSDFTMEWQDAWAQLHNSAVALSKSRSLIGMESNGLLCSVLDRVLAGLFQVLSKVSVTAMEVIQAKSLMSFACDSMKMFTLNTALTKQCEQERFRKDTAGSAKKDGGPGTKRGAESILDKGCFQFFTQELSCSHGDSCRFSHEASSLPPHEITRLRSLISLAGNNPVDALV